MTPPPRWTAKQPPGSRSWLTGAEVREIRMKVAPDGRPPAPRAPAREPVGPGPIPFEVARAIRTVESPRLRGAIIRAAARWAGLQRDR